MSKEYEFNWTPSMSVGEKHIDEQHQSLLSQTNKIIDAIASGNHLGVVDEALSFYDKYIDDHLAYEEEYMRKINYPYIDQHIEIHKGFIDTYKKLKEKREVGVSANELIFEFEAHIGNWWIEHIGRADKQYYIFEDEQEKKLK